MTGSDSWTGGSKGSTQEALWPKPAGAPWEKMLSQEGTGLRAHTGSLTDLNLREDLDLF